MSYIDLPWEEINFSFHWPIYYYYLDSCKSCTRLKQKKLRPPIPVVAKRLL